jgi:hypothetical protein
VHNGVFSSFNLAIEALKDDIMIEQRFSSDYYKPKRDELPAMPAIPDMLAQGHAHHCRFMYYETDWISFHIECFKLIE